MSTRSRLSIHRANRGKSYYVNATDGDDDNTGLSAAQAWQTIAKVNAATFSAGDVIYFKRGETWTGTALTVSRSNITFAAYGASGAKPIIDGNSAVNGVAAQNKSNLRFENLDVRHGFDSCMQFTTCTDVTIVNCDTHGAGNDNVIFISACARCYIYGGAHTNPTQRVVGTLVTCIEISDNGSDFLIDGVTCSGSAAAGISVHNHSASDPQGRTDIPTNVIIRNSKIYSNATNGINILAQDTTAVPVITVQNNISYSNDTGIRVQKSLASAGYASGITIKNNKFYNNTSFAYYLEGDDILFQQNLCYGTTQQGRVYNAKRITLYNNTIYLQPASALFPFYAMGSRCENIILRNNLIHSDTSSGQVIGFAAGTTTGADVDYTFYYFPNAASARWMWKGTPYTYANWKTNSGMDAHSPAGNTTDTAFTDESGSDFALQASSPAIGIGVNVGLDYAGSAPDCGCYEYGLEEFHAGPYVITDAIDLTLQTREVSAA